MSFTEVPKPIIAGILVSFDINQDPIRNIDRLMSTLDYLVVVDNVPSGNDLLAKRQAIKNLSIITNFNKGGLAGAYNLAISHVSDYFSDATHILFLDDDTDVDSLPNFLESDLTLHYANNSKVAAVAPSYIDSKTGMPGKYIHLNKFFFRISKRVIDEPIEVSFLINSMSLWRVSAITEIGSYSEKLAVDHIDTDYCLRAKLNNFSLILNPFIKFTHSIGDRKKYKFLGVEMKSGGHNRLRRKMISRNTIILAKHYFKYFPSFFLLCIARIFYEILGIVLVEKDKLGKLTAIFSGLLSGLKEKYE